MSSAADQTSTTINVVAMFRARPERREQFKAALIAMAEATHREEGCLLYTLQQGTEDPDVFAFVEKWASTAALDAHGGTPHLVEGAAERDAMQAQPAVVVRTRDVGAGTPGQGRL